MNATPLRNALYKVPVASTSFLREAFWDDSAIRFAYRTDGERQNVAIEFYRAMAMRHRAESFCTVNHIRDCYDTLVEIDPSSWREEMLQDVSPKLQPHIPQLHHYMIYLDSVGCFEVLAARWNVTEVIDQHVNQEGER
jgi:hypothetical protein